jgi:hypothetical protein
MLQISYSEIEQIIISLQKITKEKFPITIAVNLVRLIKSLESEYKILLEQKKRIIEEYAERDGNNNIIFNKETNSYPIKKDCEQICAKEMIELLQVTFSINFTSIPINELGNIAISPEDLLALDKIITI